MSERRTPPRAPAGTSRGGQRARPAAGHAPSQRQSGSRPGARQQPAADRTAPRRPAASASSRAAGSRRSSPATAVRAAAAPARRGGGGGRPPRTRRRAAVSNPRRRSRTLLVTVLFVFSIFAAQLLRIQGFEAASYRTAAAKQYDAGTRVLPAARGSILDASGAALATSIERRTVIVDQQAVCIYRTDNHLTCTPDSADGALDKAAAALAPLVGQPVATVRAKLAGTKRYNPVARGISTLAWRRIAALGIPGITSEVTYQRVYPSSTTAASLVGFVGDGDRGLEGIEQIYDATLKGRAGSANGPGSEVGSPISGGGGQVVAPEAGRDVRLTINGNIQWYAQNSLAQMVRKTQAASGTVIVQDVRSGKLLAVASYPTYDPANRKDLDLKALQNTAFTETFEPGSTSKIMTMAAAIEEGEVTPSTPVVIPSQIRRYDRIFHDSHPHGTEFRTVAGTLAESSNMGTIFVGETMTAQVLDTYLRKFGLGRTSGIDFIGESPGELHPWDQQDGATRYTVMFGQGVSVTAVQVASVFPTIANGGVRMPPRLVDAVADPDGTMRETEQPDSVRVVSGKTAGEVSQMLEGVVSRGGHGTQAPGSRATASRARRAPPTGSTPRRAATSAAATRAASSASHRRTTPSSSSPSSSRSPIRGYAGGVVAAPVFHDVMTYALQELGIPPTGTKPPTLTTKLDAIDPRAPGVLKDRPTTGGR